jgi:hypothetical protein
MAISELTGEVLADVCTECSGPFPRTQYGPVAYAVQGHDGLFCSSACMERATGAGASVIYDPTLDVEPRDLEEYR